MYRLGTLTLSLFLIVLSAVTHLRFTLSAPDQIALSQRSNSRNALDCEATLARGAKIPLSSATFEDLILIPGVSDILARNILVRRAAVLRASAQFADAKISNAEWHALELVHGIGPKTARKIGEYLEVGR